MPDSSSQLRGLVVETIEKAIEICGGQTALAKALGIKQSAISNWINRGQVPPDRCLAVEVSTRGKVTRYDLRPDVFGEPPERCDQCGRMVLERRTCERRKRESATA
jgi:DNA-binding transcriptional regulator YdaS (Cro superfamily)